VWWEGPSLARPVAALWAACQAPEPTPLGQSSKSGGGPLHSQLIKLELVHATWLSADPRHGYRATFLAIAHPPLSAPPVSVPDVPSTEAGRCFARDAAALSPTRSLACHSAASAFLNAPATLRGRTLRRPGQTPRAVCFRKRCIARREPMRAGGSQTRRIKSCPVRNEWRCAITRVG